MKRMWSKNELKNIADSQAKAVQKDIATLVDKDGHPRFIEGDITYPETTGVAQNYGKWSLSSSHLLIVLCLSYEDALTVSGKNVPVNLPDWIKDKLVPLFDDAIDYKQVLAFNDDGTNQAQNCFLRKATGNINIQVGPITTTKARSARYSFDLLIDNA